MTSCSFDHLQRPWFPNKVISTDVGDVKLFSLVGGGEHNLTHHSTAQRVEGDRDSRGQWQGG